jgi:hypothetical protein
MEKDVAPTTLSNKDLAFERTMLAHERTFSSQLLIIDFTIYLFDFYSLNFTF